ncbi:MAG: 5'/3'-nucleotidase SurE [bacterium]
MILVTNDDGVHSPGLKALAEAMREVGEVLIVAPDREQSAASHALTLQRPLRLEQTAPGTWAVDGTPSDAVYLGINAVLKGRRPDLVASGINLGANLGDDITYSGTVAAAMEGTLLGAPAFAISMAARRNFHFETATRFAARLARSILSHGLPKATLLNVNVPNIPPEPEVGYRVTRQGKRRYTDAVVDRTDPRGRTYYWIGGDELGFDPIEGSDAVAVLRDKLISVTPVHLDLTHDHLVDEIAAWSV